MDTNTYKCVDAGSENCPCDLAVTGDCLTCSRLRGKDVCDCDWKGVCVLNEFIFNGKKASNRRKEKECSIVSKYYTADDFFILVMRVQKGFAIRCMRPATYIFLRNPEFDSLYDVPVSILDVNLNDSTITVGIRVLSAKTKSLASAEDKILVRGPYRSGFIGREFRKMDGTGMILCSGAGLCPGIFACNLLRPSAKVLLTVRDAPFERNLVQHFLRPAALPSSGKDGRTVSAMAHQMAGGSVSFRDFDSAEEVEKIRRVIRQEKPKYILLLGSRNFSSGMYKNLEEFHKSSRFVTSNDFNICCGEGVCGACEFETSDGRRIRICKCSESVDPSELFDY